MVLSPSPIFLYLFGILSRIELWRSLGERDSKETFLFVGEFVWVGWFFKALACWVYAFRSSLL